VAAAVAAIAAGSLIDTPVADARRPPSCDQRAGTTRAVNREVRVFEREKRTRGLLLSLTTYACNRKTGRLRSFQDGDLGKDSADIPLLVLAGSYVGYVFDTGALRNVDVWNSRTGSGRVFLGSAPEEATLKSDVAVYPEIESLVLTDKGHAAWIAAPGALGDGYVVHVGAATSEPGPVIASGTDIQPLSLAAGGGLVYWTQAGTARSAVLP
jgi:hypothetical protein